MSVTEALPTAMTVSLVLTERQGPWVPRLGAWNLSGSKVEECSGYSCWRLTSDLDRERHLDEHLARLWRLLEKHQHDLPVSKAPGLLWQVSVVLWFDGGTGARSVRTSVNSQNLSVLARLGAELVLDTFLNYFPE